MFNYFHMCINVSLTFGFGRASPSASQPRCSPEEIARLTQEMDGHQEEASDIADRASALGEVGSHWELIWADVSEMARFDVLTWFDDIWCMILYDYVWLN